MNIRHLLLTGFGAVMALGLSVPANAQALEEIVVTARKREESLQDVPLSISAINAETIRERGIISVNELARFTPGFAFNSGFGRGNLDRPSIRGLTTILNGLAGSKVASSFVDGVYMGGVISTIDFGNVERIEVIKGPQSAQFGRATYGGAINYITAKPGEEFEGSVNVTIGQHDTLEGGVRISGPLVADRAYFLLSANHDEYGGEYTNMRTGELIGDEQTDSFLGKLYLTPNEQLDVTLTLGYQETDDGHFPQTLQGREFNNTAFRTPATPLAREYYLGEVNRHQPVNLYTDVLDLVDDGAGQRLERTYGSIQANWEMGSGYTISGTAGFIEDEFESYFDSSADAHDVLAGILAFFPPFLQGPFCASSFCGTFNNIGAGETSDVSYELRLASPVDNSVRWGLGLYYYDGDDRSTRGDKVIPPNPYGVPVGLVLPNGGTLGYEDVENRAIFGSLEWDLNDQWTVTAEGRWAEDIISQNNRSNDGMDTFLGGNEGTLKSFSPRVTATFKASDAHTFYGNIANGTRPGSFNSEVPPVFGGTAPDESLRVVDEETINTIEVGWKGRVMDGTVAFSVAGFYSEVTDAQFTLIGERLDTTTFPLVENVGELEIAGFEGEVTALINENLTVAATYSYTNSEVSEGVNDEQAIINGSLGSRADLFRLGDIVGKKTPRIPESQASLLVNYEKDISGGRTWFIAGDATYEGSKFAQFVNLAETGASTRVGGRIGIRGERWDATMWAKNIFDDDTPVDVTRFIDRQQGTLPNLAGGSTSPRGFYVTPPKGRQVGVTANLKF